MFLLLISYLAEEQKFWFLFFCLLHVEMLKLCFAVCSNSQQRVAYAAYRCMKSPREGEYIPFSQHRFKLQMILLTDILDVSRTCPHMKQRVHP